MTDGFATLSVALFLFSALFAAMLAGRRVRLAKSQRRELEAETRLRSLALDMVDGEPTEAPELSPHDARVLAGLLARYARALSGSAQTRIAPYFTKRGYVEQEIEALESHRAWRRATAAYSLGDMASPEAASALLNALLDPDRAVRSSAVRSLGRLGVVEAVEPIVDALVNGHVPRAVAGQALLFIGAGALMRLRYLLAHPQAELRAAVAELMGLLGSASEAPMLVERLQDTSAEVRAKAARALGRLGDEDAAAHLRDALKDRIPFVRVSAAVALGAIGDREAAPLLLKQAREDRFEAAQAAARALVTLDPVALRVAALDPEAGPHIHEMADLAKARGQ